jgi:hypothetical protein
MKILYSLIISVIFFSAISEAQTTFQKLIGDGAYEDAQSIQQTTDGGFIMVGSSETALSRIYLVKTDSAGVVLWTKTYHSTHDRGTSVQQAADGGYIICGHYEDINYTTFIIKTDASGDTLWSRMMSNNNFDFGTAVIQDANGNYLSPGITSGAFPYTNARLTKFNSNGGTLWSKGYGESFNPLEIVPYSIQQSADGGYILTGYFNPGIGPEIFLLKTDSAGTYQWNRRYGGNDSDYAWSVQPTSDSGFIMAGQTKSFGAGAEDVYLVKTNSTGDTLWTRTYGGIGRDIARSVQQTDDGGFVVAGYTETFGAGMRDVYVIKISSNGALQWSHTFGGTLNDEGASIQKTNDGGYIVAGKTESFGAVFTDIYLIKLDSAGNSVCNQGSAATIATIASTSTGSYGLVNDSVGNIFSAAWIISSIGSATAICTTGLNHSDNDNFIKIYPNPAHNTFTISFNGLSSMFGGQLTIFDVTGREVHAEKIHSQLSTFNFQLSPGIYFVRASDGERVFTQKLVVE